MRASASCTLIDVDSMADVVGNAWHETNICLLRWQSIKNPRRKLPPFAMGVLAVETEEQSGSTASKRTTSVRKRLQSIFRRGLGLGSSVSSLRWERRFLESLGTFRIQTGSNHQVLRSQVLCRSYFGADNHSSPSNENDTEHSLFVDFDEI